MKILSNLLVFLASPSLFDVVHCVVDCCGTLRVIEKDGSESAVGASLQSIFTNYSVEDDLVNGRVHYISRDGSKAIAYHKDHGGQWFIQPADDK